MTLFNKFHRRMMINRTVRELSRLDGALLNDIGLDHSNLREMVAQKIDARSAYQTKAKREPVFNAVPVTSGAAA